MKDAEQDTLTKKRHVPKSLSLGILWVLLTVLAAILLFTPAERKITRLMLLAALAGWWTLALPLLWPWRKWVLPTWGLLTLLLITPLLLPGHPPTQAERQALRARYLLALQAYKGTTYVWGGEKRFGIDCSGLVRQGLIDAQLQLAWTHRNPRLLRNALAMWWFDASAKALRDGYRKMTKVAFRAKSINRLDHTKLTPGDLAVTADGVHVLAYLGKRQWIEADPGHNKVVQLQAPVKNGWFLVPVVIVRWQLLNR